MTKVYVDTLDSKYNAHLCITDSSETLNMIRNFFITKFGEDGEGNTFDCNFKYNGFVFWWGITDYSNSEYVDSKECFTDLEMLGAEIISLDRSFNKYNPMIEYIKENNL